MKKRTAGWRVVVAMKKRTAGSCVVVAATGAMATATALGATVARQPDDPFTLSLSEQVTRDANVYRLPDDLDVAVVMSGADATRDDLVSRTSAVVDGNWDFGKQAFALNVGIDSNRYSDNTVLNNTSGSGRADWNWQLMRDWSGQLGASYGRSLAGFGAECILQNDRGHGMSQQEVLDAARRWQDAGGTHVSVVTMGRGYRAPEEHIHHLAEAQMRLKAALDT